MKKKDIMIIEEKIMIDIEIIVEEEEKKEYD